MTNKDKKALKNELEKVAGITAWSAYPDVAVLATVGHEGVCYSAIGWATRGPDDRWNELLGFRIAVGRALDKIVERIVHKQEQGK